MRLSSRNSCAHYLLPQFLQTLTYTQIMPLSFIDSNRTDSHSRSIMAAASAKQTLANLETLNTMRDNTTWISFIDNYTNMLGFEGTSFDSLRLREKLQAKQETFIKEMMAAETKMLQTAFGELSEEEAAQLMAI